ncbi:MAG: hypothetical protein ACM3S2_01675 [Ignavibacteriales bacterium]
MHLFNSGFVVICAAIISCTGCSGQKSGTKVNQDRNIPLSDSLTRQNPNKAAVRSNYSRAQVELLSSAIVDTNSFILKVRVMDLRDNQSYQDIAVKGETYELRPAFILDKYGKIADDKRNKRLLELKKLKSGSRFWAVMSYYADRGWMIMDVLDENK